MEKETEGEVLEEEKEPVQDAENTHQEEAIEIEVKASEEPEEIEEPEAEEALAEVIVPADAEEQALPAQEAETVQQERERRVTREEPRILRENSGVYSSEILEQEAREKDEREIENQLFQDLQRYQRTGEILWGEVVSVDPGTVYPGVIFNILWNKIIVSIPDREYFEPELDFGKTYAEMTERQKINRRLVVGRYQQGARVCFKIKGVERELIENGRFAGESNIRVGGSRREAMETLRDIWFYHKNRREDTPGKAREVKVGDIATAKVISVKVDRVLVECLGVETWIDSYNLNNEAVDNCRDFVKPGDTLPVRIRRLYVNEDNVYLSVSGRLNDSSKLIRMMRVRSNHLGTVDYFNRRNNIYSITLKEGVHASVRAQDVQGGIPLYPNDRVSVFITSVRDDYVTGIAMKI